MDSKNGSYNSEKFHHSIAVPRIYKDTSKLLEKYWNKEGRLNNLVYETKFQSHLKRLYGTACSVLNQYPILEEALKAVPLFEEQPQFKRSLAYVLSSEILKKNGPLPGNSKPIQVINSYHKAILEAAKNAQSQTPEQNILPGKCCPKYGRVNTLIQSADAASYSLENIGWKFIDYDVSNIKYDEYLDIVENLEKCSYTKDYHVPKLLVFPPCVEFWKMNIFKKGGIIAQNKASCLPAFVSNVKPGDTVIDACAAPGNKTCHLASLMSNEGRLIAIDKDFKRFQTLQSYLQKGGVQCAETLNVDFTALNPSDYEDVKVIVVDPSCSSSGTVAHRDEISRERITKLSNFQRQILKHALSFPKVETVVYSTCSVNEEENEIVVEDVLQCCNEFVLEDLSKRIPDHSGLEKFEIGKHCLRMNSSKDKCEGFFVAKFIRIKTEIGIKKRKLKCDGNVNKFKNKRTKTFGCLFFLAINL